MKRWTMIRALFALSILAGMLLMVSPRANAQQQTQSILTDPRMVVIPTRTIDEVSNDLDNAKATKQLADYHRLQAETRLAQVDGTIETRKNKLSDVDRRKNEAKKANKQSEVMALDIEKKANQQAIDLLNKLKDLRKTEVEAAKADAELSEVESSALELETQLITKRMEYDSLSYTGAGDLTLGTTQQVLRELEIKLLKLQKDQAEATQKVASRQKEIIARRMKLHEAQLKLGVPRA